MYQHLWVRLSYKGCKEDMNKNKNKWIEKQQQISYKTTIKKQEHIKVSNY